MGDDERRALGTPEHEAEPSGIARDDAPPALAAAGHVLAGSAAARPGAILVERPALVAAVTRIVELRHDQPRNLAPREGDLRPPTRPREIGRPAPRHRTPGHR